MVVLNRIYTRTGDDGTTALGCGERRPKYDLRVEAYGTVDETNAAIGVVRLHPRGRTGCSMRCSAGSRTICSTSAPISRVPEREGKAERLRVVASQVERLERDIDALNDKLAPLTSVRAARWNPRSPHTSMSPAPYAAGRNG